MFFSFTPPTPFLVTYFHPFCVHASPDFILTSSQHLLSLSLSLSPATSPHTHTLPHIPASLPITSPASSHLIVCVSLPRTHACSHSLDSHTCQPALPLRVLRFSCGSSPLWSLKEGREAMEHSHIFTVLSTNSSSWSPRGCPLGQFPVIYYSSLLCLGLPGKEKNSGLLVHNACIYETLGVRGVHRPPIFTFVGDQYRFFMQICIRII